MSFPYINSYQQFFDSSGSPLASGTIEFRDPTSNNLINSFPTADDADAQTNANANPLTLNASGAAAAGLFLEDGIKYKVTLKDSAGATVATHDDVRCPQFTAPIGSRIITIAPAELGISGVVPTALGEKSTYGEIYVKNNTTNTTLNSAAHVQVTVFDTNGRSNRMTPDHTNDHITVDNSGIYLCIVSLAMDNIAAQAHEVTIDVFKNNGATVFANLHSNHHLDGGAGDTSSLTISGLIFCDAADTIELWADTTTASDRAVNFEDITMSLIKMD